MSCKLWKLGRNLIELGFSGSCLASDYPTYLLLISSVDDSRHKRNNGPVTAAERLERYRKPDGDGTSSRSRPGHSFVLSIYFIFLFPQKMTFSLTGKTRCLPPTMSSFSLENKSSQRPDLFYKEYGRRRRKQRSPWCVEKAFLKVSRHTTSANPLW